MQRLYLMDMMFFIFRAFYAMPARHSPCGAPINALYGVLALFRDLWQLEQYRHVAAVFECPGPSFRKELDPEYKANRKPAPTELLSQVAMVRVACECLGIRTIHADGYEADDLIGTLAKEATESGMSVTIVSNDKDLAQVLAFSPLIELLRTGNGGRPERISADEVKQMYGVPPELIASWLALMGDASDNIKGVKGVGKKTATKLLNEHGDLHTFLKEPEKAGRFASAFVEGKERVLLDLQLATICTDVDLGPEGFVSEYYALREIDGAHEFFESLGMKDYVLQLQALGSQAATVEHFWSRSRNRYRSYSADS